MPYTKVMFTSDSEEWETPIDFFTEINKEFNFTLDVCACLGNAKCDKFYTKEDNALLQRWRGSVWCNPPYGRQIPIWVKKVYLEYQHGCELIVMLIPSRTDTKVFHEYISKYGEIRFIKGRLKFQSNKGRGIANAPFPSLLWILKN